MGRSQTCEHLRPSPQRLYTRIHQEVRGTQLEADVVDAFLRLVDKGEFRAPDDVGGGTTEDINNIHKQQQRYEQEKKERESKQKEKSDTKNDDKKDVKEDKK